MQVLITRPKLFAKSLSDKISRLGFEPILFPTIDIFPISMEEDRLLTQKLTKLLKENAHATIDAMIFMSRPSVLFGVEILKKIGFYNLAYQHKNLQWLAIGPGTARALFQSGLTQHYEIHFPKNPPYDSSALLGLLAQNLQGKTILLFKGNQGLLLLQETLEERGAQVIVCETYQRRLPHVAIDTFQSDPFQNELKTFDNIEVILITSNEALLNLKQLMNEKAWQRLITSTHFILVGLRSYELSATLGITHRFLADGADDDNLIKALLQLRDYLQSKNQRNQDL